MTEPVNLHRLSFEIKVDTSAALKAIEAATDQLGVALKELSDALMNITDVYIRDEAEPSEVVQYIFQKPDHTWMGVTIRPGEEWRYECKSDWMWWRND